MKTVYLAGRISGDPQYRKKFFRAACELTAAGFDVVNPATLPPRGFQYAAYIRMSTAMLDECSSVCFLSDWRDSPGAVHEFNRAKLCGKEFFFFEEWRGKLAAAAKAGAEGAAQNALQYAT